MIFNINLKCNCFKIFDIKIDKLNNLYFYLMFIKDINQYNQFRKKVLNNFI